VKREVAAENLDAEHPADSISRSYYAMFHAATAVLLELGIERSTHRGLWAAFGQFVGKVGLMDPEYHRLGMDMSRARSNSDYLPEPEDTSENAQDDLAVARGFVAACRTFLENR
jgi:hypothetical protein